MRSALPVLAALLVLSCATPATTSTPTIELITMSPGDELYTLWGHAALRVRNSHPRLDVGYNFGSVDIGPRFFWDMLGGHVRAYVATASFPRVASVYKREDRQIVRRRLRLEPAEARALAKRLADLPGSDHAHYDYHHFEDNCSTRVAEELDIATGGALRRTGSSTGTWSYRQLALQKVRPRTFIYALLDVLLAEGLDRPLTLWKAAFLPDKLAELADAATVDGRPLVTLKEELASSSKSRRPEDWAWPWIKLYLLFCLPLMFVIMLLSRLGTFVWAATAGLLGLAAVAGWVATDYTFLAANWNIGVLLPSHLLVALAAMRRRWFERLRPWLAVHAGFAVVLMIVILGGFELGWLHQDVAPVVGFALGPCATVAWRLRRA